MSGFDESEYSEADAFEEGRLDNQSGRARTRNPFTDMTKAAAWFNGWDEADEA